MLESESVEIYTSEGMQQLEEVRDEVPPFDDAEWDDSEPELAAAPAQEEGLEKRSVRGKRCDEHKLAQLPNIPQVEIKWRMKKIGFAKIKVPQLFRRIKKVSVYARVCYPESLAGQMASSGAKCIAAGCVAAAPLVLGGATAALAVAAFKGAFMACATYELGHAVEVNVVSHSEHTPWKAT